MRVLFLVTIGVRTVSNAHHENPNALGRAYLEAIGKEGRIEPLIHTRDEMFGLMRHGAGYRQGYEFFEYFKSGQEAYASIQNALAYRNQTVGSLSKVLEFACGFGRLTRFLVDDIPRESLHVSDIMENAVDFVTRSFDVRGFLSTVSPDQLVLDGPYDLIYVGSLFSHLPQNRFGPWLTRLYRELSPEGWLLFSTHGDDVVDSVEKDPSGFTFVPTSESGVLEGSEYGSTFVRPEWVGEIASQCSVSHLYHSAKDLWGFQDLYVASRQPQAALESWERAPLIKGRIDEVKIDPQREFWIGGWAAHTRSGAPLKTVELRVGEQVIGIADCGVPRPEVAQSWKRSDWKLSGWQLHGRASAWPKGRYYIQAWGTSDQEPSWLFDMAVVDIEA